MFAKSIEYGAASLLLLQLVTANAATNGKAVGPRIVNGKITTIANTKYIVKIRSNGKFLCGGSLVSPMFVVSAAHCFLGVHEGQLLVIGGATKLTQPGVGRKVAKIRMHPDFRKPTMDKDVAVLKLVTAMEGKDIEPIGLYTGTANNKMEVKVTGWGRNKANNPNLSNMLRTINVPIISKPYCKRLYRGKLPRLTNSMFCAGKLGDKDACSGDSGGPAVCDGKLCGIVSWGIGCATPNFPGVYTDIQTVQAFIRKNMV